MSFQSDLRALLLGSLHNNYSDNWDFPRFGAETKHPSGLVQRMKSGIKNALINFRFLDQYFVKKYITAYAQTISKFEYLYQQLEDDSSKEILLRVLSYRILGYKKVKILESSIDYFSSMKQIEAQLDTTDYFLPEKFAIKHYKADLSAAGYPLKMYLSALGIFYDFYFKQYELKRPEVEIKANPGDVVIDGGGCFGDTALYFSYMTGVGGRVFSFEFIPGNIELFQKNLSLNPSFTNNIVLAQHPLWSSSDLEMFYRDMGPGSVVDFKQNFKCDGTVKTVSIDDYLGREKINKVDFIKLDIEGAEFEALKGAEQTIKQQRPKIAVALYHSDEDFDRIPKLLKRFQPDYKFYFHHATINKEESVLFAV